MTKVTTYVRERCSSNGWGAGDTMLRLYDKLKLPPFATSRDVFWPVLVPASRLRRWKKADRMYARIESEMRRAVADHITRTTHTTTGG